MKHTATIVVLAAGMLALGSCTDSQQDEGTDSGATRHARIELSDLSLDFGGVAAGDAQTQVLAIGNSGSGTLFIDAITVTGSGSFSAAEAELDRVVEPGASTLLPVTYQPVNYEIGDATLHIASNAPHRPDVSVTLTANGHAPKLELEPSWWDFGEQSVGCEERIEIVARNVGTETVVLQDVVFTPTSQELSILHAIGPGALLGPGEEAVINAVYLPADELPDSASLQVLTGAVGDPTTETTLHGSGIYSGEVVDEYQQDVGDATDILWVVDNSCSMSDEQDSLATNLAFFLDILWEQETDFHLAVATTDNADFQGAITVMTDSTPAVQDLFADAVSLGTAGSGTEQGLRYALDALSPPLTNPGGPNFGFLRDEADLHVIVVSDEDDQSPDTVVAYVQALRDLKPSDEQLTFSGITGQATGCATAYASDRYEDAVSMTGGVSESICDPSWVDTLSNVGWTSSGLDDTFVLDLPPVEGTIRVEIDGVQAHSGWDYDDELQAVVFQPGYAPQVGDHISIFYSPFGSC